MCLSISVWTTLIAERLLFYWTLVSTVVSIQKSVAFIILHFLCYPFSRSRTNGKLNVVHQRTWQSFKMHKWVPLLMKTYYINENSVICKTKFQKFHTNYMKIMNTILSYNSYLYAIIRLIFQQFRCINQKKYCKSRLECGIHAKILTCFSYNFDKTYHFCNSFCDPIKLRIINPFYYTCWFWCQYFTSANRYNIMDAVVVN